MISLPTGATIVNDRDEKRLSGDAFDKRPAKADEDDERGAKLSSLGKGGSRDEDDERGAKLSSLGKAKPQDEDDERGAKLSSLGKGGSRDEDDERGKELSSLGKGGSRDEDADERGKQGAVIAGSVLGAAIALNEADSAVLTQKISSIQQQFKDLPARVRLTSISESLSDLETRIKGLPEEIAAVRQRGYPYREYLEKKVEVFGTQWDKIRAEIRGWLERESSGLAAELEEIEPLLHRLRPGQLTTAQQSQAAQIESRLGTLDAKVKAAEDHLKTLFDGLQREVGQTHTQVEAIKGFLELKDEASFSFLAGETVFRADAAEWVNGGDNPDGVIFLTNQRVVFEQKEKTGKTLGIFGGKQVHQVLWEVPLNQVSGAQAENKGLLGGKDMVHLQGSDSRTMEVKGGVDCKVWAAELGRMIRGEIGAATVQDPDLAERLRNAPTDCPTCGAVLPRIVAGQTSLTCKYCGTVVRI
jgi:hypothetical protein